MSGSVPTTVALPATTNQSRPTSASTSRDTLLVMGAALLTCLPYVARLGFYNDDWFFFARYGNATDRSLWSFVAAPMEPTRPASAAYHALLYWLFGSDPLGYHLTNALVFMASAGLFHVLLRRLGLPAGDSFALSIVWATLPHAATGRFWYSIFQMQASLALAFAAILCEVHFRRRRNWMWRGLALVFVVASGLFYEVALPLLALTPLIAARSQPLAPRAPGWSDRLWWLTYPLVVVLLLTMKLGTTDRLEASTPAAFAPWFFSNLQSIVAPPSEPAVWGFNLWRALDIAFVDLGAMLPRFAWESTVSLGVGLEIAIALSLAVTTFLRLWWALTQAPIVRRRHGIRYIAAGFCLFLLGWSVFLGTSQIQLSATGVGNRTAGAAAIGVAFMFIGVMQCLASLAPQRWARLLFALLSATAVASGTLVIHRIAADWEKAWTKAQDVVAQIATRFPGGLSGRALLLDGVCQYVGPATVFEASWDLQWALQARYSDPTIRADVVTSSLEIRQSDVRTTLYGEEKLYEYGSVMVYRPAADVVSILDSADDARRYFETWNIDRDSGCPPGRIGHGVDVFSRLPDVAYLAGFYDVERDGSGREWRWMDALGIIRLKNEQREMALTLQGQAPDQLPTSPIITITLNGRILDTIEGKQPIDRQFTIPVTAQGDGSFSELRIRTNQAFVPAETDPASVDRRRLGFVLYRLEWQPR